MARICIVTGSHLCNNPRVPKEAGCLAAAGHEVTVLGPVLSRDCRTQDETLREGAGWRYRPAVDLTGGWPSGLAARARRRWANLLVRGLGFQAPGALAYGIGDLLAAARNEEADLTIGHEEAGLWVAARLLREGRRASIDLEDWYSRDLLPGARKERPVVLLASLEAECIDRCASVTVPSRSMARALEEVHGRGGFSVVYNAFPVFEIPGGGQAPDREPGLPSLHWFSQTIGPGRGLDVLFPALERLEIPVSLTLTGDCSPGMRADLERAFPRGRGHRLLVEPRVPPWELAARIAGHDAGLALEEAVPDNKDTTVSNKVLQCLASGVPVVATPTRGQREVAELSPAVRVAPSRNPADLAGTLRALLGSGDELRRARVQAAEAARGPLSWERSAAVLVGAVELALAGRRER